MTEIEIRDYVQAEISRAIFYERQRLKTRAEYLGYDILNGAGALFSLVKLFEDET